MTCHCLPQDYPEYYRIISEPIDLGMLKRNIEVWVHQQYGWDLVLSS